nr:unnamed protein product [Haemonchus contortus]
MKFSTVLLAVVYIVTRTATNSVVDFKSGSEFQLDCKKEAKMLPKGKEKDVCLRLVEYSRNGRTFRKWTYERLGKKVTGPIVTCQDCPCLRDQHGLIANTPVDSDHSMRSARKGRSGSPLARQLKQQRVEREEIMDMEKEAEGAKKRRQQRHKSRKDRAAREKEPELMGTQRTASFNDLQFQDNKMEFKSEEKGPSGSDSGSAERKRREREKSHLDIDERTALKELSKLYRDLLERFEELRQKQEAQMSAESDSTRLRRLAKTDPSVKDILQDVVENIKKALHDFKTCATLAGAMLPNASIHERELSHILLELECASIHE